MCPSVKLFLPDQILSSKLLPDRHRTAHSICVTSEEKQAVRMQMSRSEIEKRDVDFLFYLLVFSCFANGRCKKRTLCPSKPHTGNLLNLTTLSLLESRGWFIQLYTANFWLWVCVCVCDGVRPRCSANVTGSAVRRRIVPSSRIFWMSWLNRFTMSYSKG